ncbi:PQ loop repeat-domain-containing protein [Scheffersomyces coipomensis]|uniref:PQ loop repeat-domain-containing protein n=1 Tax=Scheffersomyces coipomensis TaxID=1788519 RepID=UPI00315DEB9C
MGCTEASYLSSFFSGLSCISWICAQLPQIFENYKNKSAEGISPTFLFLWFMGDFLSFTSCLLNDAVLSFQIYLSVFFLCNDITLFFQYYYYNSVYPRKFGYRQAPQEQQVSKSGEEPMVFDEDASNADISVHADNSALHIRHGATNKTQEDEESPVSSMGSTPSSYNSMDEDNSNIKSGGRNINSNNSGGGNAIRSTIMGAILNSSVGSALPITTNLLMATAKTSDSSSSSYTSKETLGLILAWGCTCVYISSRCPQLYKNYLRKSVEGISPLLFGAALLGNLTYTLSILTSCEFIYGDDKSNFVMKELPYILGSSGTIIFDIGYFYQKYLYRNSGRNTSLMVMDDWN